MTTLEAIINQAWENRETLSSKSKGPFVDAIREVLTLLDSGHVRVATAIKKKPSDHDHQTGSTKWQVNEWVKKAVLLSFRISENHVFEHNYRAYDKISLKFTNWQEEDFEKHGFRVVPGTVVRQGSFIGQDCVLMPSFVNVGAYIGEKTMIDSYATVGSCVQVGHSCHISSGAVLAGVLEPVQAHPVIVEDHAFIGAQASVAEGAVIGEGAVVGMGVQIGASVPIIDRQTGKIYYGYVPPYSVVVPGIRQDTPENTFPCNVRTSCAIIVKQVTAETRAKTSINELLRI